MSVLELVREENDLVVLKVNLKDNLEVALNPWLSREYDYITVSRGENHILTVIKKNGSTFSFNWGHNGYTLISDSLEELKKRVCNFITNECHILIDYIKSYPIVNRKIYYNRNYNKWQLTVEFKTPHAIKSAYYWSDNAETVEDMKHEAEKFIGGGFDWTQETSITGIKVWRAIKSLT